MKLNQKINQQIKPHLEELGRKVSGQLLLDAVTTTIYSTDASAYKERPLAVLIAKDKADIKHAVDFARITGVSLIPRTAGTSIAGQVVGSGLVVDCSKYMNQILEINVAEKWVRVLPGVVLDELNKELQKNGLFFGPETSTSNRCMIGGMVGNNSCGAHSLVYGSTRDHTLELQTILSDGSEVLFKKLSATEFNKKCELNTLEGSLYRQIVNMLSPEEVRQEIRKEFPDPEIKRRNTGYAIDMLSQMKPFNPDGEDFNFCKLLSGSEGTLAFTTEIKLNLVDLPPKHTGLLVIHHNSLEESIQANVHALKFGPVAIELIDKFLIECTKNSAEHSKNRFFLQGEPEALLCVEFMEETHELIEEKCKSLIDHFKENKFGYAYPLLSGSDINKVWALRKAGLGLLSNIPGDAKPQPVIEDTAVSPQKLLDYITDFNKVLKANNLTCVYYAHIATGELHLRPVINLKEKEGVRLFRLIATEVARLVKKYGGSLSGEHGDGRLRGEFIPLMIGAKNYALLIELKKSWDPTGVFNRGKITDTPPLDTWLRFEPGIETPDFETVFDFSETLGYVRMAEKCNGSADCRKSAVIGGVMCPSYQATRNEQDTTRARANMLREAINSSNLNNRFDNSEILEILDLCLSCKGCKTECPSGVDMAKLKAEFLYQYYRSHIRPLRSHLVASYAWFQEKASAIAGIYNAIVTFKYTSAFVKLASGFSIKRSMPKVYRQTWEKWLHKNLRELNSNLPENAVSIYMFIDEFTNFNEPHIGLSSVRLLNELGYRVLYLPYLESGRSKISKGFLKEASKLAKQQVERFAELISESTPLIGIEPSAILSFKDEYPDFLRNELKEKALKLGRNVFTIEEFIDKEFKAGRIDRNKFTNRKQKIAYHGHCQQKSLIGQSASESILKIPSGFEVELIKSGCCGMAGSFGYEKEHYDLSMKIGELVLFPKVRSVNGTADICASGTSCRHHIKDGTGQIAKHPVEILFEALN